MKKQIHQRIAALLFAAVAVMTAAAQSARHFELRNSQDGLSTLTVYLPEHPTGRAVLGCPGGGYAHLAMQHEGHDWAPYFNNQGITYAVLKYRMPKGDRNIPLSDAYQAMKTLRDSADVWQINSDDIGIMGFSAGGHLASSVSTHAPWAVRPNFSILFYPVITMAKGTHEGSRDNFLGSDRNNKETVKQWSNETQVRSHLTPPAIILLANDDEVVPPVQNGVAYYSSMRACGNTCSLMIYPHGGHGFGIMPTFPSHQQMMDDLTAWLKALPSPQPRAIRVACIGNSITDGFGIGMSDEQGYPAQLQRMLGRGYLVKNFGVSARTLLSKGDLPYVREESWQDAQAFRPDIVIVKLGTNDTKPHNWVHNAEFKRDLMAMTDTLKALPSHPRIWLCSPIPAVKPSWDINDSIIANHIAPIVKQVARKEKVQYIDLHTAFHPAEGMTTDGIMQSDGIHPTRKGAKLLAKIIMETITKK